jgi:SAM-dependent methyltransferase
MPTGRRTECPVCGESAGESRPVGPSTVACRRCTLTYNQLTMSSSSHVAHWTQYTFAPSVVGYDSARAGFFAELWRLIARLAGKVPGKVLDVGCGQGFLLEAATARGWTADGLELSPEVCAVAQRRTRGVVRQGGIEDAELPAEHYDLVVMIDVFRVLPRPLVSLARSARALKPGGAVVLRETNIEHQYAARRFARSDPWDLQCLSPASARELCRRAGLTDVHIVPSPMSLLTVPVVRRLVPAARDGLRRAANLGIRLVSRVGGDRSVALVPEMLVVAFRPPRTP